MLPNLTLETAPELSKVSPGPIEGKVHKFITATSDKNGTPLCVDLGDVLSVGVEAPEVSLVFTTDHFTRICPFSSVDFAL